MSRQLTYKSLNLSLKSFDSLKGEFTGYASTFNEFDDVNDMIMPEAFDDSIEKFNNGSLAISINYDHWTSLQLADNLISITADETGLLVSFKIEKEVREIYEELFADIVSLFETEKLFMSIGGWVEKSSLGEDRWIKKEIGKAKDKIEEFALDHIALTAHPINGSARMTELKSRNSASSESANQEINNIDGEISAIKFLNNHKENMSNTCAKSFVFHLRKIWGQKSKLEDGKLLGDESAFRKESEKSDNFNVNEISKFLK
jgi:HK97 family phage prohead protease